MSTPKELDPAYLDRWFRRVTREFCPLATRFIGKRTTYLEIGSWAGASGEWVAKNVLATHPESIGIGIDPYPKDRSKYDVESIKAMAANRVRAAIGERWSWIYQPSTEGLLEARRVLKGRPVDLIYIDGAHEAYAVVTDFVLAWPLLRPGSVVIFDDYHNGRDRFRTWPGVEAAVKAIQAAWAGCIIPIKERQRKQAAFEVLRTDLGPLRDRDAVMADYVKRTR